MKLRNVKISNFKAIKETSLQLQDFTVIVGANGSGKSSVLQSLHWMFQSGRNPKVGANSKDVGSTLSEKYATYMPSPYYRNAGHADEFGNKKNTPQMDMEVVAIDDDGVSHEASMWIKAARNEGLSVHVPANKEIVKRIKDRTREISSYIPGLAGIPLSEEKRTKAIVHRQAAAGDANTVLRNVLRLLEDQKDEKYSLKLVERFVSNVLGGFSLKVTFDEEIDSTILVEFQTEKMVEVENQPRKPLELAGVGYLQVVQIFAYLVYFRPMVLLVDEPDSHLHPSCQEKLVRVLKEAAEELGTQIILTTHSPSIVRALPLEAKVIWMKDGNVQQNSSTSARGLMGWGLLDKQIIILTEDTKTDLLQALLSQWPEIDRIVSIWPMHGCDKLPDADVCSSLQKLFGNNVKVVLHRDRDFMMPEEEKAFLQPYKNKHINVWLTEYSDIESYWCNVGVLKAHFNIDDEAAGTLLDEAIDKQQNLNSDIERLRKKRNKIRNTINDCKTGKIGNFSDEQVIEKYTGNGEQYIVLGKTLCCRIRKISKDRNLKNTNGFGKLVPNQSCSHVEIASDLKNEIMKMCDSFQN